MARKKTDKPDAAENKKTKKTNLGETSKGKGKKQNTEEDDDDESNKKEVPEIEWTKDLTWQLINGILEDAEVKQGLFPAPGANPSLSKGGSKTKSDYHWALALLVFEDNAVFGQHITSEDADRAFWKLKIKNQLRYLTTQTKAFISEMGETGAGIRHAEDVDLSIDNAITNCWTRIQEKHPWFWEMKALVAERPNMVPVGIGNNSSGYDVLVLQRSQVLELEDDNPKYNSRHIHESSRDFDSQSEPITDGGWGATGADEDKDAGNGGGVADNSKDEDDEGESWAARLLDKKCKEKEDQGGQHKHAKVEDKKDGKKMTAPRPAKSASTSTQRKEMS